MLKQQTNILSAAFVIMATVIFSQILGLIRQRLLIAIFGASNTLGVYLAASRLPDVLFQVVISSALASAFIPVFSDYLTRDREKEGHQMASSLLTLGLVLFFVFSLILSLFAPFFLNLLNAGSGFTPEQISLMVSLMRLIIFGQLLFIIGTFFTALLQSYNHFFVPGFAAALYNLGIIIGIFFLWRTFGIYAAAYGIILGSLIFIAVQVPLVAKTGFSFKPSLNFRQPGLSRVTRLMWPRTLSIAIFQLGSILTLSLVSFLPSAGRNYVIFDFAQTLSFAPIALIGQAIAQAAFPVLAKSRTDLVKFKETFLSSFNQMLFLILPVSALVLVLRIPVVRLVFGAPKLDWEATVLTGKTLAFFALSIFAQALTILIYRAFYALHDTKTPLIVGSITTLLMLSLSYLFIIVLKMNVTSLAISYSIASILQLIILFIVLDMKTGGFPKKQEAISLFKLFLSTTLTGIALYLPLKFLDKLVFDTTRTLNLLMLTGISSAIGLLIYLVLTWLLNVEEAKTYVLLFRKMGNWREILGKSDEVIEGTKL